MKKKNFNDINAIREHKRKLRFICFKLWSNEKKWKQFKYFCFVRIIKFLEAFDSMRFEWIRNEDRQMQFNPRTQAQRRGKLFTIQMSLHRKSWWLRKMLRGIHKNCSNFFLRKTKSNCVIVCIINNVKFLLNINDDEFWEAGNVLLPRGESCHETSFHKIPFPDINFIHQ